MEFRKEHIIFSLRTVARIWGSVVLAFLGFLLFAHAFELTGEPIGEFKSKKEIMEFVFFPISTIIGLVVSWKYEGIGGAITVLGMILLFTLRPDLMTNTMFYGLTAPGILHIAYWFYAKDYKRDNR